MWCTRETLFIGERWVLTIEAAFNFLFMNTTTDPPNRPLRPSYIADPQLCRHNYSPWPSKSDLADLDSSNTGHSRHKNSISRFSCRREAGLDLYHQGSLTGTICYPDQSCKPLIRLVTLVRSGPVAGQSIIAADWKQLAVAENKDRRTMRALNHPHPQRV